MEAVRAQRAPPTKGVAHRTDLSGKVEHRVVVSSECTSWRKTVRQVLDPMHMTRVSRVGQPYQATEPAGHIAIND